MSATASENQMKCVVTHVSQNPTNAPTRHWHLETPCVDDTLPAGAELVVRGWALAAQDSNQSKLHVVFRLKTHTLSYPLNEPRGDVVKAICEAEPEGHPCLISGFRRMIPAAEAAQGIEIGFESDGLIQPAAKISWG
jgi:hypothetical protein